MDSTIESKMCEKFPGGETLETWQLKTVTRQRCLLSLKLENIY